MLAIITIIIKARTHTHKQGIVLRYGTTARTCAEREKKQMRREKREMKENHHHLKQSMESARFLNMDTMKQQKKMEKSQRTRAQIWLIWQSPLCVALQARYVFTMASE